ncbi:MAG: Hsp20/alpha crystallin family protein, partial [Parcubacteria group bacterium QH_9_35_7]
EAPLAGIDPSNVNVSIENGVLSIKGESKKEHEVDDEDYYRKEIRSGSFFRQLSLPTKVNEDGISAEFKDGVLTITCPKKERTGGTEIQVEAK